MHLVSEEENRKKPTKQTKKPYSTAAPSQPGKLHLDYKTHPHFPPKFGGGCVLQSRNYGTYKPQSVPWRRDMMITLGKTLVE